LNRDDKFASLATAETRSSNLGSRSRNSLDPGRSIRHAAIPSRRAHQPSRLRLSAL